MIKTDKMGYVVYTPEIKQSPKQYLRLGYLNTDKSFHSFDDNKRDFIFTENPNRIERWESYPVEKIDDKSKRRIVMFLFTGLRRFR